MSKSRRNLLARVLSRRGAIKESRSVTRKSALRNAASCEMLEGRVVLSGVGGGFMGGAPGFMGFGQFKGQPAILGTASSGEGANSSGEGANSSGEGANSSGVGATEQGIQEGSGMTGGGVTQDGPGMTGGEGVQGGSGMLDGGGLVGSLAKVGVVSLPGGPGGPNAQAPTGQPSNAQFTQLQTDLQKIQTDLKAVTSKSGLTVADLTNLSADEQAIATAGAKIDPKALQKAVSEIATAIAGNTNATQAKADFNALFKGTSVAQTAIDNAYSDISRAVTDSKVSTSDLTTIAADQATVQADFTKLRASGAIPGGLQGGSMVGSLADVGVVSEAGGGMGRFGSGAGPHGKGLGGQSPNAQAPQVPAALQKLQTDTHAIAAKSGVTVADLTTLNADGQAIGMAGASLDRTALTKAVTDLATAIAGSANTTASKAEFNTLFSGTSVSQTTIDKAFTDVSQVITHSKINLTDLTTIAADQVAVKAALATIQPYSQTGTATATATTTAPAAGTVSSPIAKAGTISAAVVTPSPAYTPAYTPTSYAITRKGRMFGGRIGHGRVHAGHHRGHR